MTSLNERNQQNYAQIVTENSPKIPLSAPIIVLFVLPIPKEIIRNRKLLDKLFLESVEAVQNCLPPENRAELTIYKCTILRKRGNLKAITVIFPANIRKQAPTLLSSGIIINGRTIAPYSVHDPFRSEADYRKNFRVSFRNLPHFLPKEDIFKFCGLDSFKLSKIVHQKRRLPNGSLFHTGFARAEAIIENFEEEKQLKKWSEKTILQNFDSNGALFQCCCPSFQSIAAKDTQQQRQAPMELQEEVTTALDHGKTAFAKDPSEKTSPDYVIETLTTENHEDFESAQIQPTASAMEQIVSKEVENVNLDNTIDEETDTEPTCKIRKPEKPVHYFDYISRNVLDETSMMRTYPEAKSFFEEGHNIRIEAEEQNSVNELISVELLTPKEQEELFDDFQIYQGNTLISSYYRFEEVRRRYSVFLSRENNTIICANLNGDTKITFTLRS